MSKKAPHIFFLSDETGAVTVDWVVLTAGLVGLGLAVSAVVSSGVEDVSNDIDTELSKDSIIRTAFSNFDLANAAGAFHRFCDLKDDCTEASLMADVQAHLQLPNDQLRQYYDNAANLGDRYVADADAFSAAAQDFDTMGYEAFVGLNGWASAEDAKTSIRGGEVLRNSDAEYIQAFENQSRYLGEGYQAMAGAYGDELDQRGVAY